jgi:glyoxylate carboligase
VPEGADNAPPAVGRDVTRRPHVAHPGVDREHGVVVGHLVEDPGRVLRVDRHLVFDVVGVRLHDVLGMLLGELLTVALHELPVKIVTFNNSSLGMVKLEMLVDGLPDYGTDHAAVDYAAIARAAGIEAFRVEQPGDIGAALEEAFGRPGPALVDLVTDPNALSMPPHVNADQVKGFALAAGKIVVDGGVGRMVEMARANVRNIPRPATLARG